MTRGNREGREGREGEETIPQPAVSTVHAIARKQIEKCLPSREINSAAVERILTNGDASSAVGGQSEAGGTSAREHASSVTAGLRTTAIVVVAWIDR